MGRGVEVVATPPTDIPFVSKAAGQCRVAALFRHTGHGPRESERMSMIRSIISPARRAPATACCAIAVAVLAAIGPAVVGTRLRATEHEPADNIRGKLAQARPDFQIGAVRPSVVPGLYEVQLQGGPLLYATADGDFFLLGDLFAVAVNGITNLSEQQRDGARRELLAAVAPEDMIVFAAQGETRAVVAVFTDVDCGYCQKLHQEVPALNRAGVEIRYLAYPRAGVGSASYRKIASAWCAANPQQALTRLKNRETIPDNVCPGNPVAQQFLLGQQMGVSGTPALLLENGQLLPGYMPAAQLLQRLSLN